MEKIYIQYGCGLSAPQEWINFDVSPTLRIQKIPVFGRLIKNKLNVKFPSNVLYGDIIKGLPVADNSCSGVYCSHTLEHLSLQDFRRALKNTLKILKPGGIFRCVVPDLEYAARQYITQLDAGDPKASLHFFENTLLGMPERPKSIVDVLRLRLGGLAHLWMWDHASLSEELKNAGFQEIHQCKFNDCEDTMFKYVEDRNRFQNAVAIESRK